MKSKHIISAFLLIIAIFQYSCEPDTFKCDICTQYAPEEGKVLIDFTINEENPEVIFRIYEGKDTETTPVRIDTATKETEGLFLKTEQHFSVEAIYTSGDQKVHAFDGGEIDIKEIDCDDEACYYAKVLNLDLSLIQD